MNNTPLKLMSCATCQETNLVNRPELVQRIPEIIKAMRDHCTLIHNDQADIRKGPEFSLAQTERFIKQWADRLEGKL